MVIRTEPDAAAQFLEVRAAKDLRDHPAHERHPRLAAHKNHLVQVRRGELGITQRAQAMLPRPGNQVLGERFEFRAGELPAEAELRRQKWQRDFHLRRGR